jgi:hypothetical protein
MRTFFLLFLFVLAEANNPATRLLASAYLAILQEVENEQHKVGEMHWVLERSQKV